MRKMTFRILLAIFCAFLIAGQALAFTETENACIKTNGLIPLQIAIPSCNKALLDTQVDPTREICCNDAKTATIAVLDAPNYIAPLMRFGLIAAASLFSALLVIGGLMYMGSQGAPDYVNRARKLMKNSASGLILIIFSTVILYQINPALISLTLTKPDTILAIKCCKVGSAKGSVGTAPDVAPVTGTSGGSITKTPVVGGTGFTVVEIYKDGKCVTYFETATGIDGSPIECLAGTDKTTGGATSYASPEGATSTLPPAATAAATAAAGSAQESYYFQHTQIGTGNDAKYVCEGADAEVGDYLCLESQVIVKGDPASSSPLVTGKDIGSSSYDAIFDNYGNCIATGGTTLKAIAFVESGFKADVVNSLGFTGLFQTKTPNCADALRRYKKDNLCKDLTNPENNTMAGTSMTIESIKIIKAKCPNVDPESMNYFIYLGHHGGSGTLSNVVKNTCDYTKSRDVILKFWQGLIAQGKYKGTDPVKVADDGDKTAKKMVEYVKKLNGGTIPPLKEPTGSCPLKSK